MPTASRMQFWAALSARCRQYFLRFKGSTTAQLYALVVCLTLASWATFYWGHLHSEASGLEQVRLRASTLSLAYSGNLENLLERTDAAMLGQFEQWSVQPAMGPDAGTPLHRQFAGYRFHWQLFAANGSQAAGSNDPRPTTPPIANASALSPATCPAAAPSREGNSNGLTVVAAGDWLELRRPVVQHGECAGIVVLFVEPAYLTQFADDMAREDGTVIGVIRTDGLLLARSKDPQSYLGQALATRVARALVDAPATTAQTLLADDVAERTVAVRQVPAYALAALVSVDTARQMEPERKRKHIVFIFALLFPLILIGAARMILLGLARRESMEQAMHASERLAASVFTHAREGIVITDTNGRVLDVNRTFTCITGFPREEVIGQRPDMLQSDRHSPAFYAAMGNELVQKGHWSGDVWSRHKDGALFAALLTISTVRDAADAPQHYVALFTDVTKVKDHERQLAQMAHYDSLSSLPNRVLLADRLRQAMLQCQRRGQLLVVAFLDLDNFKEVNDQYGHDVGDAILIAVAHNMKSALRDGDTLARIGGDEFVAVLVDLGSKEECIPVLDRLLAAANQPTVLRVPQQGEIDEIRLRVSTSIGFTYFPQDDVDADQLMRQADQAMYQAKQSGKNRYHLFDVAIDAALKTRLESIARIRQALLHGEFVLHYQPKVNMRTGQVIGAEALIRWMHPERGLLAPQHFLPVIENHSLSIDLGEWVFQTALNQLEAWQLKESSLCVSVNVSARHLQQEDFADRLAAMLGLHPSIKASALELEILETSAMEDMGKVTDNIQRCIAIGTQFALDDFGTGYSSLTYLKRLHAATLKIDQSFVRDMLEDSDDMAIVQSIVSLAHSFGRSVIAEGVETPAHGVLLMELGCDLAQGFGIARPMPGVDFLPWIQQWQLTRRSMALEPTA